MSVFVLLDLLCSDSDEVCHKLIAKVEAHKRIIWACSWNPFSHQFATSSRDKTVKIWAIESTSNVKQILTLPFASSVTAVAWTGLDCKENTGCIAVGMENGLIELWNIKIARTEEGTTTAKAVLALRLEPFMCHVSAVNRLVWKPNEKSETPQSLLRLASCGDDNCVRVFSFKFE